MVESSNKEELIQIALLSWFIKSSILIAIFLLVMGFIVANWNETVATIQFITLDRTENTLFGFIIAFYLHSWIYFLHLYKYFQLKLSSDTEFLKLN